MQISNDVKLKMCFEQCIECFARWKLWIRPLFITLYALAALVFVPLFLIKSLEDGFNKHDQEILIGGIFVWVAIPLSFWEIIQHIIHYVQPKLQKHVIRYVKLNFIIKLICSSLILEHFEYFLFF